MASGEGSVNVRVAVRARPLNDREKAMNSGIMLQMDETTTVIRAADGKENSYTFDHSYWLDTPQEKVYHELGVPILEKAMDGYNGTIFAYGQTGSGKSFSMTGYGNEIGIIPRLNADLFARIARAPPDKQYQVTVSYLEIYNETVRDLLNPTENDLEIREHPQLGIYVQNLSEMVVRSQEEIDRYMTQGNKVRVVGETKMNRTSSRSHSVFTIQIASKGTADASGESKIVRSKINLIDLAGSERQDKTGAQGARLAEAANINKSLSALGMVINALAEPPKKGKPRHVPYRDSKLTRLLQESLGGNSLTVMIAALSPAADNYDETRSTLEYAKRAKAIKNTSIKNEDKNAKVIRELREEIDRLRAMLGGTGATAGAGGNGADPTRVTELENMINNLEYAKQQAWDEKEKISKRFEAERVGNLAKAGLIDWVMENMKEENRKLHEKLAGLQEQKSELAAQHAEQKTLVANLKNELKDALEAYKTAAASQGADHPDVKARVAAIQQMKTRLKDENERQKDLADRHKQVQEQQRLEKDNFNATNRFLDQFEAMKTERAEQDKQTKDTLQMVMDQAGVGDDAALEVELRLVQEVGKSASLEQRVINAERQVEALQRNLESERRRHAVELERQQLHYFQLFRQFRESFEEQRTAATLRYRELLEQALSDSVALSARNAALEAKLAQHESK